MWKSELWSHRLYFVLVMKIVWPVVWFFFQIHIDIPRMNPLIALFQQKTVQEMFERILFIWAIRHPASGYVQGINDLVTPFYVVFLQEVIPAGVCVGVEFCQTINWKFDLCTYIQTLLFQFLCAICMKIRYYYYPFNSMYRMSYSWGKCHVWDDSVWKSMPLADYKNVSWNVPTLNHRNVSQWTIT